MADKLRDQQLLEAMQARYLGIGSADTLTAEWHKNVARDTINSTVGHPAMLTYISIGSGQCRERTRLALLERMIKPTVKLAPKKLKDVADFKLADGEKKAVPVREPKIRDMFIIPKMDDTDAEMTDTEK